MKKTFSLLLALLVSTTFLTAQFATFETGVKLFDHPVSGLFGIAFIPLDYNKDGTMDYLFRGDENELLVYLGDGDEFDITVENNAVPYSRPYDIIDFNGDGWDDIIMEFFIYQYDPIQETYESILLQNDPGVLRTILAVGDFNNDELTDVVTTNSFGSSQNDLSVHYSNGTSFNKVSIPGVIELGPVQVGDLEGDGDLDIAFVDEAVPDSPAILVNDGQGNFTKRSVQAGTIIYNRVLNFEDIDSDGDLDFIVRDINDQLVIYENTDNFMTPPNRYVVDVFTRSISAKVVDLNNDGVKEIVQFYVTNSSFKMAIYYSTGGLNYTIKQFLTDIIAETFFISLNPNYTQNVIRIVDVENDGDQDVILNFSAGDDPSVFLFENISEITSSNNELEIKNIQLFPNPTSDHISISGLSDFDESAQYLIYNTEGKTVQRGVPSARINVSELPIGSYRLQIVDKESRYVSSFIIQR